METNVKLFGALRKFGNDASVKINLPQGALVSELKTELNSVLSRMHPGEFDSAILAECAVATEENILMTDEAVPQVSFLAVLPPVCGG